MARSAGAVVKVFTVVLTSAVVGAIVVPLLELIVEL